MGDSQDLGRQDRPSRYRIYSVAEITIAKINIRTRAKPSMVPLQNGQHMAKNVQDFIHCGPRPDGVPPEGGSKAHVI